VGTPIQQLPPAHHHSFLENYYKAKENNWEEAMGMFMVTMIWDTYKHA
jgi:hypothetical protein